MKKNKPNGNLIQTYYFRHDDEARYAIGAQHFNKRQLEKKPGVKYIYLQDKDGQRIFQKGKECCSFKICGEYSYAVDEVIRSIEKVLQRCAPSRLKEQKKKAKLLKLNKLHFDDVLQDNKQSDQIKTKIDYPKWINFSDDEEE